MSRHVMNMRIGTVVDACHQWMHVIRTEAVALSPKMATLLYIDLDYIGHVEVKIWSNLEQCRVTHLTALWLVGQT